MGFKYTLKQICCLSIVSSFYVGVLVSQIGCTGAESKSSQNGTLSEPVILGEGLASKYSADVGLASDPDVILYEAFEDSVSQIASRFESANRSDRMRLLADPAPRTNGKSIEFRVVGGNGDATDLYRRIPGQTDVFVRFYIKPNANSPYHHTGGLIGGYNPSTPYPQGTAGIRPVGDDFMTITTEVGNENGRTFNYVYTYWNEMRGNPSSNPNGGANGTNYWGNNFLPPNIEPDTPSGSWTCYEYRVKLNSTGTSRDGTFTLWKNGKEIFDLRAGDRGQWVYDTFWREGNPAPYTGFPLTTFEGFRWRTNTALNLNFVWLAHYATTLTNGQTSLVQFDQLVVAKKYIGCAN